MTAVQLETVACEICGSAASTPVAARPDLFLGGETLYHVVQCHGCGVLRQNPRPTAATVGALYPSEYPQYTPAVGRVQRVQQLDRRYGLWKRCRAVTRHVRRGRLLDVGCATGDFLEEMARQRGWRVVGIEPSLFATQVAQQSGLSVVNGGLNAAPFRSASFDAITLWDVFEHVYNPRAVLQEAARLLRPGGVLLISHPNTASLDRAVFQDLWIGYEPPRHMYMFPAALLTQLASEYGFAALEQRCLYGSHAAFGTSLGFWAQRWGGKGWEARVQRLFFSKPVRLLTLPLFWVVDQFRRGSNIAALFRRLP